MHVTKKFATLAAMIIAVGLSSVAVAPAANANEPLRPEEGAHSTGALDPATFEGTLIVAVPSGHEIVTDVRPGQAPAVIAEIQAADAAGLPQTRGSVVESRTGCGSKIRSVASPFGYATSVQGCAVAGYPGYQREYGWSKTSDTTVCTKGKGFSGTSQVWYGTGCNGGNNRVPWGNVLAYTQMQGMSMAGVVGATYDWRA